MRTRAPVSSALSASSFRTKRRSLLCATPAFCCSPSTVRKLVQSARSNFKFSVAGWHLNGHWGFERLVPHKIPSSCWPPLGRRPELAAEGAEVEQPRGRERLNAGGKAGDVAHVLAGPLADFDLGNLAGFHGRHTCGGASAARRRFPRLAASMRWMMDWMISPFWEE